MLSKQELVQSYQQRTQSKANRFVLLSLCLKCQLRTSLTLSLFLLVCFSRGRESLLAVSRNIEFQHLKNELSLFKTVFRRYSIKSCASWKMLWCPPFQHICYIPHPYPHLPTPSISPTPIHITHPQLHPYNSWQRGSKHPLTHFQPMFHFYTPIKHQKIRWFLFSGCIEVQHWLKMG